MMLLIMKLLKLTLLRFAELCGKINIQVIGKLN